MALDEYGIPINEDHQSNWLKRIEALEDQMSAINGIPNGKLNVQMPPVKLPKYEKETTMNDAELIALAILASIDIKIKGVNAESLLKMRAELTLRGVL